MTEEEVDAAHERCIEVAEAVTKLVDQMTKGLTREADDYIRNMLNDTYRFWRCP